VKSLALGFLPLALYHCEEIGIIDEVGSWVLEQMPAKQFKDMARPGFNLHL